MVRLRDARRSSSDLSRYLLDGERVVLAIHQHWLKVVEPILTAVVAVFLALWLDVTLPDRYVPIGTVMWIFAILLIGRAGWTWYEWGRDWFVVTDKRLLMIKGFIVRHVPMMPLMKVTDMKYERTLPGRFLGYGRFIMESAGQDQAMREVDLVPRSDEVYRIICSEIFGVEDHSSPHHRPGTDSAAGEADGAVPQEGRDDLEHARPHDPRQAQRGHSTALDEHTGDDSSYSRPIPVTGSSSIYRSDDLRARDRTDDTGPIPLHEMPQNEPRPPAPGWYNPYDD